MLNFKWAAHVFKAVERATSRTVRRLRASFAIWISPLTGVAARIVKPSRATRHSSVYCSLPYSTLAPVRDLVTMIPACSQHPHVCLCYSYMFSNGCTRLCLPYWCYCSTSKGVSRNWEVGKRETPPKTRSERWLVMSMYIT